MGYGPPPLAGEIAVAAGPGDAPDAWIVAIVAGIAVTALALLRRLPEWARALAFCSGQTLLLTAPLAGALERWVYGAFPTIDKAGSLRFYLEGVHRRMILDPAGSLTDPATALIGVHVGHLWVTEAFDTVLSPIGAMNAQALAYPAFAWWAASRFCRELTPDPRAAVLAGMPFGLGLHVFRDLHWYTIEKASVGWIALYAWMAVGVIRDGRGPLAPAAILAVGTWMNLYWGLVGGGMALAAAVLVPSGARLRALRLLGASFVAVLPLAIWQLLLLRSAQPIATPEAFLWERAAHDALSLQRGHWDRIELWRALDPLAVLAAIVGLAAVRTSTRARRACLGGAALALLSLGPLLWETPRVPSPLYLAVREVIPGFWRVAKPEVFFEASWLLLLGFAGIGFARIAPTLKRAVGVYLALLGVWTLQTRAHPAFPGFSVRQEIRPVEGWAEP